VPTLGSMADSRPARTPRGRVCGDGLYVPVTSEGMVLTEAQARAWLRVGCVVEHEYYSSGLLRVIDTTVRASRNAGEREHLPSVRVRAVDDIYDGEWDAWLKFLDIVVPASVALPEGI
jgi:hypothetical protein